MKKKPNNWVVIAAILLIFLAVLAVVFSAYRGVGVLSLNRVNGNLGGRLMAVRGALGLLRYAGLALNSLGLALAIVSGIFLLRGKQWAGIVAIILAAVFAFTALISLLIARSTLNLALGIGRVLLGIAVIVLLLLPLSRAFWAAPKVAAAAEADNESDDE